MIYCIYQLYILRTYVQCMNTTITSARNIDTLPHSLHLNPVSGAGLEGGQSVGGVTVSWFGDIDGAMHLGWNEKMNPIEQDVFYMLTLARYQREHEDKDVATETTE